MRRRVMLTEITEQGFWIQYIRSAVETGRRNTTMTVILSLLPRSAASVASLLEHIPGSFTVSLIIDSTSSLLTTSHKPSLAITCRKPNVVIV